MNREIKYSGYSAVPSDYESPDGDLAASLNLIPEDGRLKPLSAPKVIRSLGSYECLCIHFAGGMQWLILYLDGAVYSLPKDSDDSPSLLASGFRSTPSAAILGNTLSVSDGLITAYILFSPDEGRHVFLGNAIPEVSIKFALSHRLLVDESYSDSVTLGYPEGYSMDKVSQILTVFSRPGRELVGSRSDSDADSFFVNLSNAVVGFLNKLNVKSAEDDKFIHPFMLRWALRLFDGSYIHQSAPILMVPNSGMPVLKYELADEKSLLKISLSTIVRRCTLMFQPSGLSTLGKWTDIVKSIDVFVSLPVYIYDQSGSVESAHRESEDHSVFSHSGVPSPVGESRADEGYHRHPSSFDADSIPLYSFPEGNREAWASVGIPALVPPRFSRKHIESAITSVSNFYLIASLPLEGDDAASDLDAFTPLDINDMALTALAARPQLPDDWRSHDVLHFTSAYPFNSRLVLAGLASTLFSGFSIPEMGQFSLFPDASDLHCTLWVRIVRNSIPCWISAPSVVPGGVIPRFLFYPDPSATEMRIIAEDGSGWKLPLKTHDFLNGSYWFDGLSANRTSKEVSVEVPIPTSDVGEELSKVFLSEVNNPFYFPLENRISVGSGSVMGLSSAAKALSQGQFGQFPLYAFTTEGVWALETNSQGSFSARQPITRDVCINPDGITQIDSAVLFPTDRGIMLISGSQTQCISDSINSDNPFDPLCRLPGIDSFPDSLSIAPFPDFLSDCGMVYDYVHQRIIVFSPSRAYAYVWSLKSKMWGMMASDIAVAVKSYPEALAVDRSGCLVDFSQADSPELSQFLITRPLKLGAPDILKTVFSIIQRGHFRKGHVRCALYGSRDLFSWHLVRSSQDHFLRGFRGSPFKYFRIALVCSLQQDESLSGCSLDFTPRFTNRLR